MEEESEAKSSNVFSKGNIRGLLDHISWEYMFLRKKCRDLNIDKFYQEYSLTLRLSFLRLFLFIICVLEIVLCFILAFVMINDDYEETFVTILEKYVILAIIIVVGMCLLSLCFNKKLVKERPYIVDVTSWSAMILFVISDLMPPVYYLIKYDERLLMLYNTFLIVAVYIFLPLPSNISAIGLGCVCSAMYVIVDNFTQEGTFDVATQIAHYSGLNLFGVFFRYVREICLRKQVIVLYQLINQNVKLRKIKREERKLIYSIIPPNIAKQIEKDVHQRVEALRELKLSESSHTIGKRQSVYRGWYKPDSLYIDFHPEVTILYADIVQFTNMTTKMDVQTLVETLHDLFVKFDIASEKHRVLRVKFLGDCYYSVAGIPYPYKEHAINCVHLGLYMIKEIRRVSIERDIEIDMRIGVHSGSVWSGVIGANKWQFDIWSKDVEIANQLEGTGLGSHIHISGYTLTLLYDEFYYEDGTEKAKNDPLLKSYKIKTYLIKGLQTSPRSSRLKIKTSPDIIVQQPTQPNAIDPVIDIMYKDLEKLPLGSEQFDFVKYIWNFLCCKIKKRNVRNSYNEFSNVRKWVLLFKKPSWERKYIEEVDFMLKYSILFNFLILCCIMVQLTHAHNQTKQFWVIFYTVIAIIIFVIFLTWFKRLWVKSREHIHGPLMPNTGLTLFFYNVSIKMQKNLIIRMFLFLFLIGFELFSTIYQLEINNSARDAINGSIVLIICSGFLFTRIPHIIKFPIMSCVAIIYIYAITVLYKDSNSTSSGIVLSAQITRIFEIIVMLYVFVTIDRQLEIMDKVDFTWKHQLAVRHADSKLGKETISILLRNLLPKHVAGIYIKDSHRHELYYEDFPHAAVMFASIKHVDIDSIHLLNEIICQFDEVLFQYQELFSLEKIKVSGKTYMAACGLDIKYYQRLRRSIELKNRRPSSQRESELSNRMRISDSNKMRSSDSRKMSVEFADERSSFEQSFMRNNINVNEVDQRIIRILTTFATDIMRTVKKLNVYHRSLIKPTESRVDTGLQIGIAYGPVMAGVVGSTPPHYDIWGNVVNLAARLDQTGIENKIHVDEVTANVLRSYNIRCTYRGMTEMKGFDAKPTYFIDVDENYNFIPIKTTIRLDDSHFSLFSPIVDNYTFTPRILTSEESMTSAYAIDLEEIELIHMKEMQQRRVTISEIPPEIMSTLAKKSQEKLQTDRTDPTSIAPNENKQRNLTELKPSGSSRLDLVQSELIKVSDYTDDTTITNLPTTIDEPLNQKEKKIINDEKTNSKKTPIIDGSQKESISSSEFFSLSDESKIPSHTNVNVSSSENSFKSFDTVIEMRHDDSQLRIHKKDQENSK